MLNSFSHYRTQEFSKADQAIETSALPYMLWTILVRLLRLYGCIITDTMLHRSTLPPPLFLKFELEGEASDRRKERQNSKSIKIVIIE